MDAEGNSTGRYSTVANWGGWQTALRIDGVQEVDFALLSVGEIVPPSEP